MAGELTDHDNGDVHIHAQVATLAERTRALTQTADRHETAIDGIRSQLSDIKRLIYIGLGGVLAVGGIASFFGWNILKMLGK